MTIRGDKKNILLLPFLVMTISIVLLSVLAQYIIHRSLKELKADVENINVANNQKTLSHEIVQNIAADNLVGLTQGVPISELFTLLEKAQEQILKGQHKHEAFSLESEKNKYYDSLVVYYKKFVALIELNINDKTNSNELFLNLLVAQGNYISGLNAIVTSIYDDSNNKVRNFEWRERYIMIGSILVIALEVLFIFLPAIKTLNKQNEYFKTIVYNQSHLVRHPVTSIQSILFLMEESHTHEELKDLIPLLKKEVYDLDKVINATMITALQEEKFSEPAASATQ